MRTSKEVILDALYYYRENNEDILERAKMQFRGWSESNLNKGYGDSGQTHKQILDECREHQTEINNTIIWANTL